MMKSILCLTPDGVQLIRDAKFAEYVPKIFSDFVFTPLPSDVEGLSFYDAHVSLLKEAKIGGYGYFGSKKYLDYFRTVFERLDSSQTIELWVEPSLNSHIHSFHLLTLLAGLPNIQGRLFLNLTSDVVGMMNSQMLDQSQKQPRISVTNDVFKEAKLYWEAFRSSNPEKWVELLRAPSRYFPAFNQIKKRFVLQLPLEPTGLRLVDKQVLKYVNQGMEKTVYILGNILVDQLYDFYVLDEYSIWDAIFRLAAAPFPAITGLPLDPFDYSSASRSNAFFRNKCFESKPRLTPYGEALLKGTANWRDHNQVDYWWGGTHITNDNYWSFDPIAEKLKQS